MPTATETSATPAPSGASGGSEQSKRRPISRWTLLRALAEIRMWWRDGVIADLDHVATIERVRGESLLTSRYIFMTAMSAGIAILGLLLSSPAVVIGAMLLSPLMSPIIGTGFSLATGDADWLRRCGKALAAGSLFAILFCALIVFFSPLQTVTEEIAARTRPNLFDLLVALFSALAGSYAVIRGREGTIVGVAIATALMPPIAVVGFGLATFNWTVFAGALGLFITNLVTIGLTAAIMARLYGFESGVTNRQGKVESVVILAVFIAMAVPLGFSLRTIAWEANGQRIINQEVAEAFTDRGARRAAGRQLGLRAGDRVGQRLYPRIQPQCRLRGRTAPDRAARPRGGGQHRPVPGRHRSGGRRTGRAGAGPARAKRPRPANGKSPRSHAAWR